MMMSGKIIGQVTQFVFVLKPPKVKYSCTICFYYKEHIADFRGKKHKKLPISRSLRSAFGILFITVKFEDVFIETQVRVFPKLTTEFSKLSKNAINEGPAIGANLP